MHVLWFFINLIQGLLILLITALCGIGALVFRIFLPAAPVVRVVSHVIWSPLVLAISGVRLKVIGRERIRENQPAIYISNHESQLDIAVLVRAVTVPLFFVAKRELEKVPVLGWYMNAMGMIFVDRGEKEKAMLSMRKAIDIIRSGKNVVTFPEGTRTRSGELLTFRRGTFVIAKDGELPVVPVAIKGTRSVLASGSYSLRPGRVTIVIGDPVPASAFAHLGAEETAQWFRGTVESMLREMP